MKMQQVYAGITVAVLAVFGWSHEVKAQNFFGSPQASPQAASPQGAACYPTGCTAPINIPPDAVVPNPHPPGTPGTSPDNCIVIYNGCPKPQHEYTVNKYYYVYYKIVNKDVPYDKINVVTHALPKVCSAETPCPPCVAAGGFGKGEHAGTISSEEELQAIANATESSAAPAPVTPAPAASTSAEAAATAPATPAPSASASTETASAPAKMWVWLPNEGVYGYGSQRPDGLWDIDAGSRVSVPPSPSVAANQ